MKALILMIIAAVFAVGHLISPENFRYYNTETVTPADLPAVTAEGNSETANEPAPTAAIIPVSTQVPAADTGSQETIDRLDKVTDPEAMFGTEKTDDTFERGSSGFGLSAGLNDDENIRIIALNNRLSLEPKKSNGWISWRLRPPSVSDSAVKMEFSIVTCARGDRTGIMMRSGDYSSGHGYYFSLSCEGTISILRDTAVLSTADARGAFKNSSGDINVMTAIAYGNMLTIVLNDEPLLTVQDETYKEGFNGFFTSAQGQNTLTMDILSFKEYYNQEVN